MKKWIVVVATIAVGILFLTFQGPAETKGLTLKAQKTLANIGVHIAEKPLRHYIHYVLYFILGFAVCGLCQVKGWRLWVGALVSCGIGLFDEGLKVLLPTREFDVTDLLRDFVGVAVAVGIVWMIGKVKAMK